MIRRSVVLESKGDQGLVYEQKVYNALKKANISGLDVGSKPSAGFSRHGAGDIEVKVDGKPFNVEVKLSANDQMGAGQLIYDYQSNTIHPHENLANKTDPQDLVMILKAAKKKVPAIREYIEELRNTHGIEIDGFPARIPKPVREKMTESGFSQPINARVETTSKYIIDHYNAKGVYYIQIGGSGLFYLGSNPLNLPIPPFVGSARVEMRLKYSGGQPNSDLRRAEWVAIGRMLSTVDSPYTLDDVDSVKELFSKIGGIVKKPAKKKAMKESVERYTYLDEKIWARDVAIIFENSPTILIKGPTFVSVRLSETDQVVATYNKVKNEGLMLTEASLSRRTDYDGPGKGKLIGELDTDELLACMEYHRNKQDTIKRGVDKNSALYTPNQAAEQSRRHAEHYWACKDALERLQQSGEYIKDSVDMAISIPVYDRTMLFEHLRKHYAYTPIIFEQSGTIRHRWSKQVIGQWNGEQGAVVVQPSLSLTESLAVLKRNSLTKRWKVSYKDRGFIRDKIIHAHPSWDEERIRDYFGNSFVDAEQVSESVQKYKNIGSTIVKRVKAFRNKRLKSVPYGFAYSMTPSNDYSGVGAPSGDAGGSIGEAAYKGNIGAMEVNRFYQVASPEQIKQFRQLLANEDTKSAWRLVQKVTGVRLAGREFR
jgi:hypothetical protein